MGLGERRGEKGLAGELDGAAEIAGGRDAVVGMVVDGVDVAKEAEIGLQRDLAKHVGMEVELVQHERIEVRHDVVKHLVRVHHVACALVAQSALRFEPARLHFAKIHARHDVPLGPVARQAVRFLDVPRTQQVLHVLRVHETVASIQRGREADRLRRLFQSTRVLQHLRLEDVEIVASGRVLQRLLDVAQRGLGVMLEVLQLGQQIQQPKLRLWLFFFFFFAAAAAVLDFRFIEMAGLLEFRQLIGTQLAENRKLRWTHCFESTFLGLFTSNGRRLRKKDGTPFLRLTLHANSDLDASMIISLHSGTNSASSRRCNCTWRTTRQLGSFSYRAS